MTSDARQDGLHLMALLSTQKSLLFLAGRSSAGSPRAPSSAQGARVLSAQARAELNTLVAQT